MQDKLFSFIKDMDVLQDIVTIIVAVAIAHLCVIGLKRFSRYVLKGKGKYSSGKIKSVTSLITSVLVFALYFTAIGLILKILGVSLTAYLASASVMGLAVGFGSQGMVQDVVTGITLIFSDLFDIGDMVEISGQTGIVQNIGMRFTVLENPFGARVYIPNRTISNVINYPKGYVRCLVDIHLPSESGLQDSFIQLVESLYTNFPDQFPGIMIYPPSIEGRIKINGAKEILRIKFRIWPGRGGPIENTFKQELLIKLKELDETYQDWMVSINYEIERRRED